MLIIFFVKNCIWMLMKLNKDVFIIYKVMKDRKILMKYNVYFIFSLMKI